MKKLITRFFILLFLIGCKDNKIDMEKTTSNSNSHEEKTEEKEIYIDDNPIKLGLYMNKKLTSEYKSNWLKLKDICSLEVYFTTVNEISISKQKEAWNYYYNTYQKIDKYKVGYNVSFIAEGKKINKTILKPSDVNDFAYYVQIYLYDDINQVDNTYYSHLTDDNYNDNSILSSIKITAGSGIEYVESDINITVFTYDDDDFDNNEYRGGSKFSTIIKRS